MIVTTTSTLEGIHIVEYLGPMAGEAAFADMTEEACDLGASAIVGIDYESLG